MKNASINQGQSTDMATITEFSPSTTFVTPSEVHQYDNISEQFDSDKTNGNGGGNGGIPFDLKDFNPDTNINLENIQKYFATPDEALQALINAKYTGKINGQINEELNSIASILESKIEKSIGANVKNKVLSTNVSELKNIVNTVFAYNKYKNITNMNKNERFLTLSKVLLQNK